MQRLLALLLTGSATAQTCAPVRVSVDAAGGQADRGSSAPCISADGRHAAFLSSATNLVAGDTNGVDDVYVVELASGAIERASVGAGGSEAHGPCSGPSLSADGNLVCFASFAADLAPLDANGQNDVYVRDRAAGTIELVSRAPGGAAANGSSYAARISPDGRRVAFVSWASDLVAGDTNWTRDVYVHDRQTGLTTRVAPPGVEPDGPSGGNFGPRWSEDGRLLAFASEAANLVAGDTNGEQDVYVHDLAAGTIVRVSVAPTGVQHDAPSDLADLSLDGRTVLCLSAARSWGFVDDNDALDLYAVDRATLAAECVSRSWKGTAAAFGAWTGTISRDGRFVAFVSDAETLVPLDGNNQRDLYLRDRLAGTIERANVVPAFGPSTGTANFPAMDPGGDRVLFTSLANDLAWGDSNDAWDVFLVGCHAGRPACHGAAAPCPCGNHGAEGAGCAAQAGDGARLVAQGRAALSRDTLSLVVSGVPRGSLVQLHCGAVVAGNGTPFGDGVRCFGSPWSVSGVRSAVDGTARFGFGVAGDQTLSQLGAVLYSPDARHYQVRYRDGANHCTPATFNFSAALRVDWEP